MELLSVAIFHKNFAIIKYMVEKFKITEGDSPFMNVLSFYNSILPDNSDKKINEPTINNQERLFMFTTLPYYNNQE